MSRRTSTHRSVRTTAVRPRSPRPLAFVTASVLTLGVLSAPVAGAIEPDHAAALRASLTPTVADSPYLVGRGVADVTGEVAEAGMMGYADTGQVASGLHMRQRARAFVIADRASGQRVVHVTADVGMIFQSVRDAVLMQLERTYGSRYNEANVMLSATHTHAGPGGFSHHNLYNLTTLGFHDKTFRATVDGIVASIVRAEDDLAPSSLSVSRSTLTDANVNRSKLAFDRNPAADRAQFPTGTDTASTTLEITRNGEKVGALNWFAVHATSMTTGNTLVSPDNKGYAAWAWEHELEGVDHQHDEATGTAQDFVAAFAQTNAGDMSPNLDLKPGQGPTDDEFENTRILGNRQLGAARANTNSRPLKGGVDSRIVYVNLADTQVSGDFTPDGRPGQTCSAAFGAAFAAGSTEDGGGGLPIFKEGKDGGNPVVKVLADALYTASPALKACQSPKEVLLPVGALDLVQQKLPVQLVRIGDQYLIGMPGEVTAVAGLRLRREVAKATGVPLANVLVQGYANAYAHYVTTPEEYAAGEYEGASTLFGRNELPAFQQTVSQLAGHMKAGTTPLLGAKERNRASLQLPTLQGKVVLDLPQIGKSFGDVLTGPRTSYRAGERAQVVFAGAHPNNDLRHGDTYLLVERKVGSTWVKVADDGDFATRFSWKRDGIAASKVTLSWDVPRDAAAGTYRMRWFGSARNLFGTAREVTGTSPTFIVG